MKKNELRGNLIEVVTNIKEDKKLVNEIKKGMKKYKILPGQVQSYFNNPDLLWKVDIETVYLFIEQVYSATKNQKINPSIYFSIVFLFSDILTEVGKRRVPSLFRLLC